jgi:SAM-dependent methyltransferase
MDKRYFKEYYKLERKHWWFRIREEIIIQTIVTYIKPAPGIKILNVGCATGRSSEYLSQFGEVTSMEYDVDCCRFLTDELHMQVIQGSATELPFENEHFDFICAFDVIEHIDDHMLAVQEICRVAKPGGFVFITVPAFMDLWNKHDIINHHFRRYRLPELMALFSRQGGGSIIYKSYFNSILFPAIWIFRKISSVVFAGSKREELRSDFNDPDQHKISNSFFSGIFMIEKWLLRHFTFPFGVSAMLLWKKNKSG